MESILLTLFSLCVLGVSYGQETEKFTRREVYTGSDENGSWTVLKSYDKEGKMIAYDSSYTQKHNSEYPFGDIDSDSTFQGLGKKLDRGLSPLLDEGWVDSLGLGALSHRFFNEENWGEASDEFNQLFEEMDKMRQQLLDQLLREEQRQGQIKEDDWQKGAIDM